VLYLARASDKEARGSLSRSTYFKDETMLKRLAAATLIAALFPTMAVAQSLKSSIRQEAAAVAAQQQRPAARGRNPNKTIGVVLIGAGLGLVLLSALASSTDCPIGQFGPTCTQKANGPLLFGGLGAVGVGITLMVVGRNPNIAAAPGGITLGGKFRF
jgi:hypothetical protein